MFLRLLGLCGDKCVPGFRVHSLLRPLHYECLPRLQSLGFIVHWVGYYDKETITYYIPIIWLLNLGSLTATEFGAYPKP